MNPIIGFFAIIVSFLAFMALCYSTVMMLKTIFPCKSKGPFLHNVDCDDTSCKCRNCNTTWIEVGRIYSIASDGDPTSYLPVWERKNDSVPN